MVSLCITDDVVFPMGYKKKRWQYSNLKVIQWRIWYLFWERVLLAEVCNSLCFRYGTSGNHQVPCRLVKESACGAGYEGSSFIYGQYVEEYSMEGKDFRTIGGVLSSRYVKGMTSGRPWVRWGVMRTSLLRWCPIRQLSYLHFTSGLVSHGDYHIVHSMMAARS